MPPTAQRALWQIHRVFGQSMYKPGSRDRPFPRALGNAIKHRLRLPIKSDDCDVFVSHEQVDDASGLITPSVEELLAQYGRFGGGRMRTEFFDRSPKHVSGIRHE